MLNNGGAAASSSSSGCSVVESASCSVGGVVNSMRGVVGSSVHGASTAAAAAEVRIVHFVCLCIMVWCM